MWQGYRRGFTAAEKTELWDRWQRGESLKAIGRAFGKPSSSIYCQVAPHGGIRPAPRRRSRLALTLAEREEISRGIAAHQSTRSMARLLGRSPSTVSREPVSYTHLDHSAMFSTPDKFHSNNKAENGGCTPSRVLSFHDIV